MANSDTSGPEHPVRTRRHNYRYFFYSKHHKAGKSDEAQWLLPPDLERVEEFWIFDMADELELLDEDGNLYGLRQNIAGKTRTLGTRGEQVAKFPVTVDNQPWHGYPIWPIAKKRDDEDLRPIPKVVLDVMVEKEVIDSRERKRLRKGDHI